MISGIFTIAGAHDCESDLAAMAKSCGGQPDHWNDGAVHFIQTNQDKLPFYQRELKLAITGDIRLDNRDELFSKLSVPSALRQEMGDAELILIAYKTWKENCTGYLLGDYVFAIWDQENKELFCCNDHFGSRSIFYYNDGQRFIFSTHIQAITAVQSVNTSLNYDRVAYFADDAVRYIKQEESWFTHIFQLLPATTLIISTRGIKIKKYWQPELGKELQFKDDQEYREAFQEIFFEAVNCRLRSDFPVTATLSGGLDSSSVVSAAAKILEKQNRELHVFAAVLPDKNDLILKDERYYIDQFKSFPNIKIHYATAQGKGFLSDLDRPNLYMAAPSMSSRNYLMNDFVEKAQSLNSKVILDGLFGELSGTTKGDGFYAELFSNLEWPLLWKELKARKTLVGDPIYSQLRAQVIKPFLPDFIKNYLHKRDKADLNISGYNFFQPEFADELRKRAAKLKASHSYKGFNVGPNQRINQLEAFRVKHNKAISDKVTGTVEFRSPFADKRVIEFCLNTPSNFKVRNGYKRSQVRIGLDQILPPEIQRRNTKSPFSPDYMRRYNAQINEAKAFFDRIASNDPVRSVVDVEKMKLLAGVAIKENETDKYKIQLAMHHLPKSIYMIYFLRQFKEFRL